MFAPPNYHGARKGYAAVECRKMFDAWVSFIFKIPDFQVYTTTDMTLGMYYTTFIFSLINSNFVLLKIGIRTTAPISFKDLSTKLVGFLEYITVQMFEDLQTLQYPYLYSFKYTDKHNTVERTYYFALFGTIALCTPSEDTNVQLSNFDTQEELTLWKTTMTFNDEIRRSNDGGFTLFQSADTFEVRDGQRCPRSNNIMRSFGTENISEDLDGSFLCDGRRKSKLFVKVSLHDISLERFNDTHYAAGDEIFVKKYN
jgi:hypothetical protein